MKKKETQNSPKQQETLSSRLSVLVNKPKICSISVTENQLQPGRREKRVRDARFFWFLSVMSFVFEQTEGHLFFIQSYISTTEFAKHDISLLNQI